MPYFSTMCSQDTGVNSCLIAFFVDSSLLDCCPCPLQTAVFLVHRRWVGSQPDEMSLLEMSIHSRTLPPLLWFSPTSSSAHLSFSICLSSCNISVCPFPSALPGLSQSFSVTTPHPSPPLSPFLSRFISRALPGPEGSLALSLICLLANAMSCPLSVVTSAAFLMVKWSS